MWMELLPTSIAAMRICCKQEQVVANRTTQGRTHLAHALRRSASVFGAHIELARGGDPKAIHRARVATRRLREALAVAGAALGGDAATLRREFKAITAALGPVRELDVSRRLLLEMADDSSWPVDAVSRVEQHGLKQRATITAIVPARTAGHADVVVTNPGGSGGTLPAAFTYSFDEPVTLTPSANVIDAGGEMSVSWTAPTGRTGDWIAVFRVGRNYEDDWYGLTKGATSGTHTLTAPSRPGQYQFRYLVDDGFHDVARSSPVTVR